MVTVKGLLLGGVCEWRLLLCESAGEKGNDCMREDGAYTAQPTNAIILVERKVSTLVLPRAPVAAEG